MSTIHNRNNPTEQALPMQVGTASGQTNDLIKEIGQSGAADSPVQVEEEGVLDRDHNAGASDSPMPIITSD